jgi:hypothetical protein
MMVNGKILLAVGSVAKDNGSPAPTWWYEYDYSADGQDLYTETSGPGNATVGSSTEAAAGDYTLLALPDGTILASQGADASGQLYVYVPDSAPLALENPPLPASAQIPMDNITSPEPP